MDDDGRQWDEPTFSTVSAATVCRTYAGISTNDDAAISGDATCVCTGDTPDANHVQGLSDLIGRGGKVMDDSVVCFDCEQSCLASESVIMSTGFDGPNYTCQKCYSQYDSVVLPKLKKELAKIKEELRWRWWPSEKPPSPGWYLTLRFSEKKQDFVITDDSYSVVDEEDGSKRDHWSRWVPHFWRPIGPFPGENQ